MLALAPGFAADRSGSVTVMTALSGSLLLVCAGLGVDTAAAFAESRRLQGVADLAAMAGANNLDHAGAVARQVLDANADGSDMGVTVTTGAYSPDPAIAASQRFTAGGASPNAVHVEVRGEARLMFGQMITGKPTLTIIRRATAARTQMGAFTLGSRLASLQGGVANQLLSALTGSEVSLSVMDYDALATARVDLFDYAGALRTQAGLEGASFERVLASRVTVGQALTPLAALLERDGQTRAAAAIRQISRASSPSHTVDLSRLIDLGAYGSQDHITGAGDAQVRVSAVETAMAILTLAQGGRQLTLDLAAAAPGLADLKGYLAIGERPAKSPWLTVNGDGSATVRTAQARLALDGKLLDIATSLGVKPVTLGAYAEAASAEAKLSAVNCSARSMTVAVKPAIGQLALARVKKVSDLTNFGQTPDLEPLELISLPLVKATAFAKADIGGGHWQNLAFTPSEIARGTVRTARTDDAVHATAASLTNGLRINVQIGGLGVGLGGLSGELGSAVTAAAPKLDDVLNTLTGLLGVRLGEADIRPAGLRCHGAALIA